MYGEPLDTVVGTIEVWYGISLGPNDASKESLDLAQTRRLICRLTTQYESVVLCGILMGLLRNQEYHRPQVGFV